MLTKVPGDYTISSLDGLKGMLTNVEYLGHAYAYNRIVARNVYPQIVPEELFWPCFNHISEYDLEGNRIKSEQASKRYQKVDTPKIEALLSGDRPNRAPVLVSTNGKSVYVQTRIVHGDSVPPTYMILDRSEVRPNPKGAYILVRDLDSIFQARLLERLNKAKAISEQKPSNDGVERVHAFLNAPETEELSEDAKRLFPNPEQFEKSARQFFYVLDHEEAPYRQLNEQFQAIEEKATSDTTSIDEDIKDAKRDLAQIEREFRVARYTMSNKDIQDYYAQRKKLQGVIEEYESKKKNATELQKQAAKFLGKVNTVREKWGEMDLQHKQWFIHIATQRITLDELAPGWLTLTIEWLPVEGLQAVDEAFIWRPKAGKPWTTQEEDIVHRMYANAPRSQLLEALPTRSWTAIKTRAARMGLSRPMLYSDTDQHVGYSKVDLMMLEEYGLDVQESNDLHVWWQSATTLHDGSWSPTPIMSS